VTAPAVSPLLLAFLRALVFVGLSEAIFYRLLPAPVETAFPSMMDRLHTSVDRAGSLTFILAFLLVIGALLNIAHRSLRFRLWPAGLNGFLVVCLVCLAGLGLAAMLSAPGPVFALAFALLAMITFFFIAMQAFAGETSLRASAFTVFYAAALLCSAFVTFGDFATWLPRGTRSSFVGSLLSAAASRSETALIAGTVLICLSSIFAFLAYADLEGARARSGALTWLAVAVSIMAAAGFAAGSTLAPARLALLGRDPGTLQVVSLTFALFAGTLTALLNLLNPQTRLLGYGLLLLVLAGFPVVIAHQHLLVVLGSVLVFAPWHAVRPRFTVDLGDVMRKEFPGNLASPIPPNERLP
jgi:hypothetical protein